MTGELGMAVLQQHPHIANAVLHINSTIGTLTGSQVLWLTGHTYYFQLLRLLTSALVCCMVAVFNYYFFNFGSVRQFSLVPQSVPRHLLQSLMCTNTS